MIAELFVNDKHNSNLMLEDVLDFIDKNDGEDNKH